MIKIYKNIILLSFIILFTSCSTTVDGINKPSTVEIGSYKFMFPTKFYIEECQGLDSYVGSIIGDGIEVYFDYGMYTSPSRQLSNDEFEAFEDEFEGHYRQIIKPVDSKNQVTRLHIFRIADSIDNRYEFNKLTLSTKNIEKSDQEIIIETFKNIQIIE